MIIYFLKWLGGTLAFYASWYWEARLFHLSDRTIILIALATVLTALILQAEKKT